MTGARSRTSVPPTSRREEGGKSLLAAATVKIGQQPLGTSLRQPPSPQKPPHAHRPTAFIFFLLFLSRELSRIKRRNVFTTGKTKKEKDLKCETPTCLISSIIITRPLRAIKTFSSIVTTLLTTPSELSRVANRRRLVSSRCLLRETPPLVLNGQKGIFFFLLAPRTKQKRHFFRRLNKEKPRWETVLARLT